MPPLPSLEEWASLLHKCKQEGSTTQARRLCAYMLEWGLHAHATVGGNHLLALLVDVGSMGPAHLAFDRMPNQDDSSWNLLITGYAKYGHAEQLLSLYKTIPTDQSIYLCGSSIVALLKACTKLKDLDTGNKLHSDIALMGLHETDVFVGSTLIDMYAKCGFLAKAEEVFDKLFVRNVVSWNALITGYLEHALGKEVIECFEQMQSEDIFPDAVTVICTLKACANIAATSKGRELHGEILRRGLDRELLVGSTLVDMYAKCGLLEEAQKVFDNIPLRDVILWTVLITGYADIRDSKGAIKCYNQMQSDSISPSAVTFACALKVCTSMGAIDKGQEMHVEITKRGLMESEILVGNALMDLYAKCLLLTEAQDVFDKLLKRDQVSWNTLISGYVDQGHCEEAIKYFKHMENECVCPDAATFVCILKACGTLGCTLEGQAIHAEIAKKGLDMELFVGSTLVDSYARRGSFVEAHGVFEKLPSSDVVSWTALIAGYAEHGLGEEALSCFNHMLHEGISPAATTLVCSLKACGSLGARDKGYGIHVEITRKGVEQNIIVGSSLVDMYAKCGSVREAQAVFDRIPIQNVVSWTSLIAGYAQLGETENVFHILDMMRIEGIQPNVVTISSALNACSRAGLVDFGLGYFEVVNNAYGCIPAFEHYTCLLDLLCRASQIEMAVLLMKEMPFHPRSVVCHTVLGACKKWSIVELGRWAFDHAMHLDEGNAATYICMLNIYADIMA